MSQNDMTISNQGFPATRADINSALQALASTSSGATEPSTMFANQLWFDTAANKLKIRNEANSAWYDIVEINESTGALTINSATIGGTTAAAGTFTTVTSATVTGGTAVGSSLTLKSTSGVGTSDSIALKVGNNGATTAMTANTSGNIEFRAGTAALPAITTTGDTNTGIFFPAADTIAFTEGGVESMRITASGALSIPLTGGLVVDGSTNVGASSKYISGSGGLFGANNSMALNVPSAMGFEFAINNATQASINTSGIFSCNLTQSAAGNGYVKLPSGIYIQWGVASATTGGTTSNFPIAFPSTCWSIVAVNNNQANPPAPRTEVVSASQFKLTVSAGSPTCNFIAIGN